ncbi:MAG: division/cell wall cluster transcriptional repressor MraZ [Bacillota bacterium]|nr:division/cell wall cluster transcriptional repressor MraZ [Bacillota bacterium]
MLIGEYVHAVDAKGRLFVPSKFRESLGERFIVTCETGFCLSAYSPEEWAAFSEKLRALPKTDAVAQAFLRNFSSLACECELDKQGRILIPQNLREIIKLANEAVLIGKLNVMEIWSPATWNGYRQKTSSSFDETLKKMAEWGI